MVARLHAWFVRQTLTVKLLIAVPLLALAALWSAAPGDIPATPTAGNRLALPAATSGTGSTASTGSADGTSGAVPVAPGASSQAAPAATLTPHQEPRPMDGGLSWGTALRTVVSLGAVLALILVSARGLKHVMAATGQLPGGSAHLKVLETTHIPAPSGRGRAALHLIEAGNRLLLVGATDTQLTLLAEFDGDEERALRAERQTFDDVLAVAATPVTPHAPVTTAAESAAAPATARPMRADSDLAAMLRRLRESAQRLEGDK
jgi:flagellar biogenesis protein FliO